MASKNNRQFQRGQKKVEGEKKVESMDTSDDVTNVASDVKKSVDMKWLDSLKVKDLKAELKKRSLDTSGLKKALKERLLQAMSS